jgi:hypothetical protein
MDAIVGGHAGSIPAASPAAQATVARGRGGRPFFPGAAGERSGASRARAATRAWTEDAEKEGAPTPRSASERLWFSRRGAYFIAGSPHQYSIVLSTTMSIR